MTVATRPNAIICDIDKTLSIPGERDIYDMSRCEEDSLCLPIASLVRLCDTNQCSILFVTGRSITCWTATARWIQAQSILPFSHFPHLHMRAVGDQRPNVMVKRDLYLEHIQPHYTVLFALEDTSAVINMYRALGIVCLQVIQGEL